MLEISLLLWVLVGYLILGGVTFFVYLFDKRRAQTQGARVPERQLHLLALLGGWPGAWLAQRYIRHKNRKVAFQRRFRATVVLHCVLALFVWYPQLALKVWQQLQPAISFLY